MDRRAAARQTLAILSLQQLQKQAAEHDLLSALNTEREYQRREAEAKSATQDALRQWDNLHTAPRMAFDRFETCSATLKVRYDNLAEATQSRISAQARTEHRRDAFAEAIAQVAQTKDVERDLRHKVNRQDEERRLSAVEDLICSRWRAT